MGDIVKNNLNKICVLFVGIIWLFNGISYLLLSAFSIASIYTYVITFLLCITYVFSLICFVRRDGIMSLESLLLVCLGFFCFGRLFFYLIGKFDFMDAPYAVFSSFHWETKTVFVVLNYYLIFLTVLTFFSIFHIKKKEIIECKSYFPGRDKVLKIFSWRHA